MIVEAWTKIHVKAQNHKKIFLETTLGQNRALHFA